MIPLNEARSEIMNGLSSEEAQALIKKYGYNEIPEKEETWLHRLIRRFWGPIPWMIEIAAILSAVVKRWQDFTLITILLLTNAIVDFYQESKARNAIAVLKKKLAHKALVLRDAKWQEVEARELVPGDIITVKIGDIVPADVKLLGGGDFLLIDQSALTGESLPVNKKISDEVYANGIVKQGEMVAQVTKTGMNTYFGKTVSLVAKAQREERSHFQSMVMHVGDFLIFFSLVSVSIIIIDGIATHQPLINLLIFSLVLIVSAIPVAMPAVLTVTMAIGAKALAAKDAILSRLPAIEELAGMTVLCSDKTGTLTQNRMSLADPFIETGYEEKDLMLYAALASKEENKDPIEVPIFEYLGKNNLRSELSQYKLEKFTPFDPIHKRTEAVYKRKDFDLIVTKGAPQVIIEMCDDKEFDKKTAYESVEDFANKGFRSLGVAYRRGEDNSYHFIGLVPLFDPPREDSKQAIEEAKAKGVDVKMVTGDNIAVSKYIASILNIGDNILDIRELKGETNEEYIYLAKILSNAIIQKLNPNASEEEINGMVKDILKKVQQQLDEMPIPKGTVKKHESEIFEIFEKANGFAEVFPEDKYFVVDKLQKANHIVGMTGDGVNDAPALKKADCGIAVSGATDAARAAADIVLMSPGLRVIVDAIKVARQIFERMKSYTTYRIAETIRIIVFMTLAIVIYKFYPLTALMIILLALFNDIPILTIAYDNTKVREKPVRWDMTEMLTLSTWLGLAGVLSSFTLFAILMSILHMPQDFIQSAFFAKLIVAGHSTLYNTRIDEWFFKRPLPSRTLFLSSLLSAIAGTVISVYGFGLMTPIGWKWGLFLWVYALSWFVFNDAVKMVVLRYYRSRYQKI